MRVELAACLHEAEHSDGWNSNKQEPWVPIIEYLAQELVVPRREVHAAKIQRSSARKTLWQGRLHRTPSPKVLFLAADESCGEKAFEMLSRSVEERFHPPSAWADGCFVVSGGRVSGYIEREGVGLASWLRDANVRVEECGRVADQIGLRPRLRSGTDPRTFVSTLETKIAESATREFLADSFSLEAQSVLVSMTKESANAAKGRWEGRDVDPDCRYRLGAVGASEWAWGNAVIEIMGRMEPADLSLDLAVLIAKPEEGAAWSRVRAFVSRTAERREQLTAILRDGGVDDIRVVDTRPMVGDDASSSLKPNHLRVREADEGEVRYEVSRPRRRIHDLLTNWLRQWGNEQGLTITEGTDQAAMYDALVQRESQPALLIEAKTSASPGVVRLAVGQLMDYGRVLSRSGVSSIGVLLLPENERLTDEMRDLLKVAGVSWGVLKHSSNGGGSICLALHHPDGSVETAS